VFNCDDIVLNLHSTVVLLKAVPVLPIYSLDINLHSTVVLLKVPLNPTVPGEIPVFTFYCSSIKGSRLSGRTYTGPAFTFYCSSIKGITSRKNKTSVVEFTFYCSSIKGHP